MLLKEKNKIIEWLDKYDVENYTLVADETYGYIVDVDGWVNLWGKKLDTIAVKFGTVNGYFDCLGNRLTSLQGSPYHTMGDFSCNENKLTSLKGASHKIDGVLFGYRNKLDSLEGLPFYIGKGVSLLKNPALGELQNMIQFNEIKAYLLADKLANALNIKDNNKKIKL